LDFIGEIHPPSSGQHRWILTTTYYFTKWIEFLPTRRETDKVIISFLEENIFSRFGCREVIITDNVASFKSTNMVNLCEDYGIKLKYSTSYYPQGNNLAKSSNKSVVEITKKLLEYNKRAWDSKLKYVLWFDRVRTKRSIGTSSFQLVYGMKAMFLVQLDFPIVKFL
jgi:transposase InsO family protein